MRLGAGPAVRRPPFVANAAVRTKAFAAAPGRNGPARRRLGGALCPPFWRPGSGLFNELPGLLGPGLRPHFVSVRPRHSAATRSAAGGPHAIRKRNYVSLVFWFSRDNVRESVTSAVMCQGEKGWDSLHFVFVGEDGEEDAVHRGSILKDSHGAGSAADLAKAAFDGVCGSDRLALGEGRVAKAGQNSSRIVAQARRRPPDRLGPIARRSGVRPSAP